MPLPAPPALRMAYDRDGTICKEGAGGVVMPSAMSRAFNGEAGDAGIPAVGHSGSIGGGGSTPCATLVFPEPREIIGVWGVGRNDGGGGGLLLDWYYSTDTTNGADGTWTPATTSIPSMFGGWGIYGFPGTWRTGIITSSGYLLPAHNVTGLRFGIATDGASHVNGAWSLAHIYGYPTTSSPLDILEFWQPSVNAILPNVTDFGDMVARQIAVTTMRVHNRSASVTAYAPVLSIDPITDSLPTQKTQYLVSSDGSIYVRSYALPDLAPGATSPIVYVRDAITVSGVRTSPSLGPYAARIIAASSGIEGEQYLYDNILSRPSTIPALRRHQRSDAAEPNGSPLVNGTMSRSASKQGSVRTGAGSYW